ncbi:MAG: PRD domain-containing protein, partial [Pseudobutyrivibrio sp.]|nr:PRD domain-containing protein [Pseudobutyrivibrio sp.]
QKQEPLKIDMNEYVSNTFPESFRIASEICHELSKSLGAPTDEMEIGYLAMHIERVKADVLDS